jgi:hypothetical protein
MAIDGDEERTTDNERINALLYFHTLVRTMMSRHNMLLWIKPLFP